MPGLFASLTEPQATVLASLITVVAAVVGVSLGSLLFGNKVRDLRSGIEQSDKLLNDHRNVVSTTLNKVQQELEEFRQVLDANLQSLSDLKGSIGQLADTQESLADNQKPPIGDGRVGPQVGDNLEAVRRDWDTIRAAWDAIRGELESIATGPRVDGRTKAKYARIDRRKYSELVEALASDGLLGDNTGKFRQALEIWNKYKTRRAKPIVSDVQSIGALERDLVSGSFDALAS